MHFCTKCMCMANKAITDNKLLPRCCTLVSRFKHTPYKLKFHDRYFPRSTLMTSSQGCPQQVVRVYVLVDLGERHDTRTNGRYYTTADRRPTNQVSAWQAEHARHAYTTCYGHPCDDVTRMLRGNGLVEFKLHASPVPCRYVNI